MAGVPSEGKMGGGSVAGGADSVGTLRVDAAGGFTGGTFTVPPGLRGKFGGGRVSGNDCASVKAAFFAFQAFAR